MRISRQLKEFLITVSDLVIHDWVSANFTVTIVHQPTSETFEKRVDVSKDDYLLVREEISGRRTDFLERDPVKIADYLLSHARFRYHRRCRVTGKAAKPVTMGICLEQIQIVDWDRKERKFVVG